MARHIAGDAPPGLLEMPGIKPEQVAGFYRAAAGFYRRAPWRKLGYETAIKVECDRFESGPWYAVVMGQSGLTFGVALYDDLKTLKKLWAGEMSDEENARETVALTVTFGDETGDPRRRPGRRQETRLGGGGTGGVPVDLSQGAGPEHAPAAGLGTGTDGGLPAGDPGVRGPAPAR